MSQLSKDAWEELKWQYQSLKDQKCAQTKRASGCHYTLAFKLREFGIDIRGCTNDMLEGIADMLLARGYHK